MRTFFVHFLRVASLAVIGTMIMLGNKPILADPGTSGTTLQNVYSCTGPDTPKDSPPPVSGPNSIALVATVPCAYQYLYVDLSSYDSTTSACITQMKQDFPQQPYGTLPDETAYNQWVDAGNTSCPVQ